MKTAKSKAGPTGSSPVLSCLKGKRICFAGKFAYGVQNQLTGMAEAQLGTVVADLDASTDFLILTDVTAGKGVQKNALALNAKGACIQVLDVDGRAWAKAGFGTPMESLT